MTPLFFPCLVWFYCLHWGSCWYSVLRGSVFDVSTEFCFSFHCLILHLPFGAHSSETILHLLLSLQHKKLPPASLTSRMLTFELLFQSPPPPPLPILPPLSDCLLVGMQAWPPHCVVFLPVSTLFLHLPLSCSVSPLLYSNSLCPVLSSKGSTKKKSEGHGLLGYGETDGHTHTGVYVCYWIWECCNPKGGIQNNSKAPEIKSSKGEKWSEEIWEASSIIIYVWSSVKVEAC